MCVVKAIFLKKPERLTICNEGVLIFMYFFCLVIVRRYTYYIGTHFKFLNSFIGLFSHVYNFFSLSIFMVLPPF